MTTLQAIGFTVAGGSTICVVSMGLFGVANYFRHPFIAPRATARPRNVIFAGKGKKSDSQDRGNPWTGWVPWVMSLSYETLLTGVPGTGTRHHGMKGSMLRVNLDGIVLLRFHALCLRVTAVATALFLLFLLPNYVTAQCYRLSDAEALERPECESNVYNLTNYEQTTIANIPTLTHDSLWDTILAPDYNGVLARLYAVVICFGIVSAYLLFQLYHEWINVLAMRRVYYLEADVWGERREELKDTLLFDEQKPKNRQEKHFSFVNQENGRPKDKAKIPIEPHLTIRDPWIPHPEQRDTVSNVALYSVLVGGLPSLPDAELDLRDSIDWQLNLATSFFDHCVPNQPGFSSSVAAVTIIPGASDLSRAWRAWYLAAKRLRRLKFIRTQIAQRRRFEIEEDGGMEDSGRGLARVRSGRPQRRQSLWSPAIMEEEEDESAPREIYQDAEKNQEYYRQVLGSLIEQGVDSHVDEAMSFGPEQTAVYSNEFATSAGACCPNGCCEGRIRGMPIDDLLGLEKHVAAQVHEANLSLKDARRRATKVQENEGDEEEGNMRKSKSFEELPQDMGLESNLQRRGSTNDSTPGRYSKRPSLNRQASESTVASIRDEVSKQLQAKPPLKAIHEDHNDPSVSSFHSDHHHPIAELEAGLDDSDREARKLLQGKEDDTERWKRVESIVEDMQTSRKIGARTRSVPSGIWSMPNNFRSFFRRTTKHATTLTEWAKIQSTAAIDDISRESTYAVVTFTSRQAAVAARHCMADGRASGRWETDSEIPIPPLADAAAWDLMACRSCCRPVTLSINDRQKNIRNYVAIALLITIYTLYTIPLTLASSLVAPERLAEVFPQLADRTDTKAFQTGQLVSGMLSALIWTSFFALCPIIFKAIANFGSKATSVAQAEFKALQYFWWFMLTTAFTGQLLAQMILYGWNDGVLLGSDITSILRNVALAIPSTISASWLNWIIVRFLVILPLNYVLQINTFLFFYLGMPCCSRVVRGGGPGGPMPYRIYVDSGVVLMCCLALAPASPLLAPACFMYFLFSQPILRRAVIFVYRPKFDGGGLRFPFIFDMVISALIFGQILLCTSMALKQALGPAILAAAPVIPTYLFSKSTKKKFLRAYWDAALMQTSLLDGWNTDDPTSVKEREEFRRFLVDAHKAAYVPVCIAGSDDDDFMTAEPAVVVPLETEIIEQEFEEMVNQPLRQSLHQCIMEEKSESSLDFNTAVRPAGKMERRGSQFGATLRRARNTISAMRTRLDSSLSNGSDALSNLMQDEPTRPASPRAVSHGSIGNGHDSGNRLSIGSDGNGFERTSDMVLPSIYYRNRHSIHQMQPEVSPQDDGTLEEKHPELEDSKDR